MKKYFFLIGALISGYIGLTAVAWVVNPSMQDLPGGFLAVVGIIGAVGLFGMRFCWKKFREL
jgi:hypothetical protein